MSRNDVEMNLDNLRSHVRVAAVAEHDERLAIIIKLCQALKSNLLNIQTIRALLQRDDIADNEVSVLAWVLADDMLISKQYRYFPANNAEVYQTVIDGQLRFLEKTGCAYQYMQRAWGSLIQISPPQPEICDDLIAYIDEKLPVCNDEQLDLAINLRQQIRKLR